MKQKIRLENIVATAALAGLLTIAAPHSAHAVPYASAVSESGGTVTFYLNESADNVKVVFSGPSSTLDLGALGAGSHNFARGGAASYEIRATKSTAPLWTQISSDTNTLLQFFAPVSLSVNRNPASTNFGRIYVLETIGGSTGTRGAVTQGIFAINPDITDAFGQGNNGLRGGLDGAYDLFNGALSASSSRYDPFQIEVGADDYVYISDAQDPRAGVFRASADLSTGEIVLQGQGNTTAPTIHTVLYGIDVKGSLTSGDLKIWCTDGQWQSSTAANSILRWDIGAGPLPYNTAPTVVAQPGPLTSERDSDLDVAPDGNIFMTVSADGGTGATGVPAVRAYSSTGTMIWSSVIGGTDVFTNAYSLEVSPDNTKLAIIRRDRQTWVVGLTNGPDGRLPDISTTNLLATFTLGSLSSGRAVNWDAAGNLYVANRSTEQVRIFSPGGTTTAITRSAGTFEITVPANTVSITNAVTSISENNFTPLVFTVSRTGNTALPLFVSFLFTGTASNGVDHTAFPTSFTFPAGVTATNVSITVSNDTLAEFSESLTVVVNGGTNYAVGTPASATVTILDDDTPELSMSLAQAESRLLEGFDGSKVGFQVTRKGLLSASLVANLDYSSGAAVQGVDFNGPSVISINANAVSTNFNITPINDQAYEGNESAIATVTAGGGYSVGPSNSATATIIDDEVPAGALLFADDFETDSSANWITNSVDGWFDSAVDFAYDYSQLYVPPAPGGSSTKGLRFRLNETSGNLNAVSASPATLILSENYRLKFNMWINYNGPMFDGGAGSTMHLTAGLGTTPDHANLSTSGASDGIWFIASGDGGSTLAVGDCSAYAATSLFNDDSNVYAAGTGAPDSGIRRTTHPYYALWGNIPAPAAQLANYVSQTGTSGTGNLGVSWHSVVISKITNDVTWVIDGILIATIPADSVSLSTNVFVGFQDVFPGVSGTPAMSFVLVDNLRVETYATAPLSPIDITQIRVVGNNVEIYFTADADDEPSSFVLRSSGSVNTGYGDVSATITEPSPGKFKAVRALAGSVQFYRIKRL